MDDNMPSPDGQNLRNPRYFPPLQLIRSENPEQWLDRRTIEWATAGKTGGSGRIATGALYDVACGKRWPLRLIAKLIANAIAAGATAEWADQAPDILREYIERKRRQLGVRGAA